jgi:NitT/TauT family transport system substrate-binding protein
MNNVIKFGIAGAIAIAVILSSLTMSNTSQTLGGVNASNSTNLSEHKVLRIGYFANINHAQAVIGIGRGDFQRMLGNYIEVKGQLFNAGPSAVEALFANQIDVAYVGPNPAINGYVKSNGDSVRVISGVASGGAVFVVRNDSGIQTIKDFAGKKFASPQLGNTQDVALRKYLLDNGYKTKENGGSVEVIPATNADILTLMVKKQIDGAWVAEPWGAKLVHEAGCRIFLDERTLWPNGDFVTAQIITSPNYIQKNPDVIKKLIEANLNETNWINAHQEEAIPAFNTELVKLTGKSIPANEFKESMSRIKLTYDPIKSSLYKAADDAYNVGYFKTKPDLTNIYDLRNLNDVLTQEGLKTVG